MNSRKEEFLAREREVETHGVAGLRITWLQTYREAFLLRQAKPR